MRSAIRRRRSRPRGGGADKRPKSDGNLLKGARHEDGSEARKAASEGDGALQAQAAAEATPSPRLSAAKAKAKSEAAIPMLSLKVKGNAVGNEKPPARGPSFIADSHQYSLVKTPEACASGNAEIMCRTSSLSAANDVYSSIDRMIALEAFKGALKRSSLLSACSEWMVSELFKQSVPLHVKEGDVLQRRGDTGEIMLVTITCGVIREEDASRHPAGLVIGESALVDDAAHESTFIVASSGVILAIHRMHYRQIAIQGAKLRHFDDPKHATLIADLPLLAPLNDEQLERIAKTVMMRRYMPGEQIVKPGDVASGLFVVKSGQVTCWVVSAASTLAASTRRSSLSAKAPPPPIISENASVDGRGNGAVFETSIRNARSIRSVTSLRTSSLSDASSVGGDVTLLSLNSLEYDEKKVRLRVLGPGDQFGESSLAQHAVGHHSCCEWRWNNRVRDDSGRRVLGCRRRLLGRRRGVFPQDAPSGSLSAILELVSYTYHRRIMRKNPLLSHLGNGQLDVLLQSMEIETFLSGSEIFPRKETSDEGSIYLITQGYVKIFVGEEEMGEKEDIEKKEEKKDEKEENVKEDYYKDDKEKSRASALPRYISETAGLDSHSFVGSFIGSIATSSALDEGGGKAPSEVFAGSAVMLKGECFGEETVLSDQPFPLMHIRYRAMCRVSCVKLPRACCAKLACSRRCRVLPSEAYRKKFSKSMDL